MLKNFCDKFEIRLTCLTIFLVISYGFLAKFTDLGLLFLLPFFSILGSLVLVAQLIRIFFPKIRKMLVYQILMLFDLLEFAQFIRTKMNEVQGKGKKKRHIAMIGGLLLYSMSLSLIVIQAFFGLTIMNIDNGTTSYSPPIYHQITVGSLIILSIATYTFAMSILLMGYGFYQRFEKSEWVRTFVDNTSKQLLTKNKSYSLWIFYTKRQKYQYAATLTIMTILLLIEFYYLGFIMAPAQMFGTTAEGEITAKVLSVFGNWTNVIIADIGVLSIIILTLLIAMYIIKRLDASVGLAIARITKTKSNLLR